MRRPAVLAALMVPAVLAAAPVAGAREPTTLSATTLEHTAFGPVDARALAAHWGLREADVARYRRYMALEGRYFYAHLDPVLVLGLIETDPEQRVRYAERYLAGERRRIGEQTAFANLVADVQRRRYGREPPVDFSILPQAAGSPEYRQARARRLGLPPPPDAPAPPHPVPPEPATLQAGDTVDFLVEPHCRTACYDRLRAILANPKVRVLLYGRGFPDDAALVAWLEQWPDPAPEAVARVEPRRFDPVVFAGHALAPLPVALLRRRGVVVGTP
ncbi:MAG: hypothetical protein EA420_03045 [Candidatus Competibacteraceae bacterium]|nr:MAG: hypothetical protein EA420_03045 [Candidatus Competibacteraceae bacterium]